MKKILITGGAGYIGSMVSTKLVQQGFDVTVVDKLNYDSRSLCHLLHYEKFNFINRDILDKKFMKSIIHKYDYIIPLAALVGAPLCEKFKKKAIETNLNAIRFLVKNLKKKQRLIFTNSNSGYGIGDKKKFCDEKSPLNPISLYGRTKVDAEKCIMEFGNSITFRLATVFGYSYRMRTDLLLNNLVLLALKNKKLNIFEPHFRRNFIHVRDVADAIIFAIKNFNNLKNNIYNLGMSKANVTKIDLVKKIKKNLPSLKIKFLKNKKDPDKRDYYVSNIKIERKGFKAKISIDQGIKEMIKVYKIKLDYKNNY